MYALRFSIVCLVTHAAPHPFPREIRFGCGELTGLPLLFSQFPVLSAMSPHLFRSEQPHFYAECSVADLWFVPLHPPRCQSHLGCRSRVNTPGRSDSRFGPPSVPEAGTFWWEQVTRVYSENTRDLGCDGIADSYNYTLCGRVGVFRTFCRHGGLCV